jgi:hypothetical protein
VNGPQGSATIAEIAKVAHLRMDGLPPGEDPPLDVTSLRSAPAFSPMRRTALWSRPTPRRVLAAIRKATE